MFTKILVASIFSRLADQKTCIKFRLLVPVIHYVKLVWGGVGMDIFQLIHRICSFFKYFLKPLYCLILFSAPFHSLFLNIYFTIVVRCSVTVNENIALRDNPKVICTTSITYTDIFFSFILKVFLFKVKVCTQLPLR